MPCTNMRNKLEFLRNTRVRSQRTECGVHNVHNTRKSLTLTLDGDVARNKGDPGGASPQATVVHGTCTYFFCNGAAPVFTQHAGSHHATRRAPVGKRAQVGTALRSSRCMRANRQHAEGQRRPSTHTSLKFLCVIIEMKGPRPPPLHIEDHFRDETSCAVVRRMHPHLPRDPEGWKNHEQYSRMRAEYCKKADARKDARGNRCCCCVS